VDEVQLFGRDVDRRLVSPGKVVVLVDLEVLLGRGDVTGLAEKVVELVLGGGDKVVERRQVKVLVLKHLIDRNLLEHFGDLFFTREKVSKGEKKKQTNSRSSPLQGSCAAWPK